MWLEDWRRCSATAGAKGLIQRALVVTRLQSGSGLSAFTPHAHTQRHTHRDTHTHTHVPIHTHTWAHTHTWTHTLGHTNRHTYTETHLFFCTLVHHFVSPEVSSLWEAVVGGESVTL